MKETENIRQEYKSRELRETDLPDLPMQAFDQWIQEALDSEVMEPTAMTLTTVGEERRPHSRVVLLKGYDENGIKFFTNYNSQKGKNIATNPFVSINFFWKELERQLRVEGQVVKLDPEISKDYFQSRPRASQLAAWSSNQSSTLNSREELETRFKQMEEKFEGMDKLPLPPFWGGYLIRPDYFEFWQGRMSRMHDRIAYKLEQENWVKFRLAP